MGHQAFDGLYGAALHCRSQHLALLLRSPVHPPQPCTEKQKADAAKRGSAALFGIRREAYPAPCSQHNKQGTCAQDAQVPCRKFGIVRQHDAGRQRKRKGRKRSSHGASAPASACSLPDYSIICQLFPLAILRLLRCRLLQVHCFLPAFPQEAAREQALLLREAASPLPEACTGTDR